MHYFTLLIVCTAMSLNIDAEGRIDGGNDEKVICSREENGNLMEDVALTKPLSKNQKRKARRKRRAALCKSDTIEICE